MAQKSLLAVVNGIINKFVKMGPDKWVKGHNAVNANGYSVSPLSRSACKFCNQGVAFCVIGTDNLNNKTFNKLDELYFDVLNTNMVSFNDFGSRTFGENLDGWFKLRSYLEKHKNVR